jgi:hypothetical protein
MQSQSIPATRAVARLVVRPEFVPSMIRLLDTRYGDDEDWCRELNSTFASLAAAVRAGQSIDVAPYPTTHDAEMASEFGWSWHHTIAGSLKAHIEYEFEYVVPDSNEKYDWRYLSDLALLAADIEAALVPA